MYHSLGQLCLHWQHRQNSCVDAEGWYSCLRGRIIPLTHKNATNKQNSNLSRPHQSNFTIWTTTLTISVGIGFRITAENLIYLTNSLCLIWNESPANPLQLTDRRCTLLILFGYMRANMSFCLEYMQLFNITEKITCLMKWVFSPLQCSPFCNSLTQYSTFKTFCKFLSCDHCQLSQCGYPNLGRGLKTSPFRQRF